MSKVTADINNALYKITNPGRVGKRGMAGDGVQEVIDDAAKAVGKKTMRGFGAVATGGFGKGLLLTALIIVGLMAIGGGIFGFDAGLTLGEAVLTGITNGIVSLFSPGGLTALGIGGTIGAISDVRKQQNKINAELAQTEENLYEVMRGRARDKELAEQRMPGNTADKINDTRTVGHAARELQRRDAAAQLPAYRG